MKILAENSTGVLWNNDGNETIQDSFRADASKFRVGAPYEEGESGGGGAFSIDVIGGIPGMPAGKRVEIVNLAGGLQRNGGGELGINITKPGTWHNISDAAQQKVVEFRADEVEFKVPVKGITFLKHGSRELHLQSDGNLVLYDTGTSPWTVLWASGTQQ